MAYRSTDNVRIMHLLPLSLFVSHIFLLTAQGDFMIAHDGFPTFVNEIICIFSGDWINFRGASLFVMLCNGLNIAESGV